MRPHSQTCWHCPSSLGGELMLSVLPWPLHCWAPIPELKSSQVKTPPTTSCPHKTSSTLSWTYAGHQANSSSEAVRCIRFQKQSDDTFSLCMYGLQWQLQSLYPHCSILSLSLCYSQRSKFMVLSCHKRTLNLYRRHTSFAEPHISSAFVFKRAWLYVYVCSRASLLTWHPCCKHFEPQWMSIWAHTLHWLLIASPPNGEQSRGDLMTPKDWRS